MIKHNNSCFQVMVVPSHRNQRLMCGGNYYEKIILTGGGTAGHVTPNLALLPALREEDFEIHYIGSYNGIERRLIEAASIPYDGISSGKLRRYFDLKNFSDPLRVLKGYFEARKLMKNTNRISSFPKAVLSLFRSFWLPSIIKCLSSSMNPI